MGVIMEKIRMNMKNKDPESSESNSETIESETTLPVSFKT